MSKVIVVAIDGPGGAGKSTVSRRLASRLGFGYVDTGAMYRVVGLLAAEKGLEAENEDELIELCDSTEIEFAPTEDKPRVLVAARDLSEEIRRPEVAQQASKISTSPPVRERLVAQQRAIGVDHPVVMEGRDIGTVVFPDAMLKVFLNASPRIRAERRALELDGGASEQDIERMVEEISVRDHRDRNRVHSPLRAADDAVVVDTTEMDIDDVVTLLFGMATERQRGLASKSE